MESGFPRYIEIPHRITSGRIQSNQSTRINDLMSPQKQSSDVTFEYSNLKLKQLLNSIELCR